ncbi:hypothetical protein [Streptomyces sp. NPDC001537]|jgi:hypothetical protein
MTALTGPRIWPYKSGRRQVPNPWAAALLDDDPGFDSYTDDAVRRPAAQTLVPYIPYEGQET